MSMTLSTSKPALLNEATNLAEVMKPGYLQTDKMLQQWTNHIAYAGTFDMDVDGQHVIHHIDISMFPNNAEHNQVQAYKFGKEEETGTDTLHSWQLFLLRLTIYVLLWRRMVQQTVPTTRHS